MYVNFHPNKEQLEVKVQRLFDLEYGDSTHTITFTNDGADITDQVTIFVKSLSEAQRIANLLNRDIMDLAAEAEEYERQQEEEGEHVRG